jgi:hypothetical protein
MIRSPAHGFIRGKNMDSSVGKIWIHPWEKYGFIRGKNMDSSVGKIWICPWEKYGFIRGNNMMIYIKIHNTKHANV